MDVALRIFIINMNRTDTPEIIAFNPKIISVSGRIQERTEGCLSLPNYSSKVKRRNRIIFSALNYGGG